MVFGSESINNPNNAIPGLSAAFSSYYQDQVSILLSLRLKAISEDLFFSIDILKQRSIWRNNGDNQDTISNISSFIEHSNKSILFLPLNIYSQHLVGIALFRGDTSTEIYYMDSEKKPAPPLLKLALSKELEVLGGAVDFYEVDVLKQKYQNCGSQVIENFVALVADEGVSQEDAIPLHSMLLEASLLKNPQISAASVNNALPANEGGWAYSALNKSSSSPSLLSDSIFSFLKLEWALKKFIYSEEIDTLTNIMVRHKINKSIDILKNHSDFRREVLSKLHHDKCSDKHDFQTALNIEKKFQSNLSEAISNKLSEAIPAMQSAIIGFKYTDVGVDLFRVLHEPTQQNLQKALINAAYLYNTKYSSNASLIPIAIDILGKAYIGEYTNALYSIATAAVYVVAPVALIYVGIPAINFMYSAGILAYSGYSAIKNAYLFYQEVTVEDDDKGNGGKILPDLDVESNSSVLYEDDIIISCQTQFAFLC